MLQSLRDQSGKWFIKIIFAGIIFSFAFFGIGDMIRTYNNSQTIAKIGTQKISLDEFRRALKKVTEKMKSGGTPDIRIQKQILDQLIDHKAIEQYIEKLNIDIPNSLVLDYIKSIPFLQKEGSFDKRLFHRFLAYSHMSEGQFLKEVHFDVLVQVLFEMWSSEKLLPKQYVKYLHDYLFQTHVFNVIRIEKDHLSLDKNITTDDVLKYYLENKDSYLRPEERSFSIIIVDNKTILDSIEVSKEECHELYLQKKDTDFTTPKTWVVTVVEFKKKGSIANKNTAIKKAINHLKSNKTLDALKKQPGIKVFEKKMTEETLPNKIKHLNPLDVALVTSSKRAKVYRIENIVQPEIKTYEQAKKILINDIKQSKLEGKFKELRNKIDDDIAAGYSFVQISKTYNLKIIEANNVLLKSPINVSPDFDIKKTMWNKEEKTIDVVEGKDDSFAVVYVKKVTPSKIPELKTIQQQVEKDVLGKKQMEQATNLAKTLVTEIKNEDTMKAQAAQHRLSFIPDQQMNRFESVPAKAPLFKDFTNYGKEKLFEMIPGQSNFFYVGDGVMVVMCTKTLPPKEEKNNVIGENIGRLLKEDLQAVAVRDLRTLFKVEVDDSLFVKEE